MSSQNLAGRAILVVEDDYLLADDIRRELTDRDATVIGPAATVEQGQALLRDAERLDGVILDINLRGEEVFPLADALLARDIPFVFATGYDAISIPDRFAHFPRCEKPIKVTEIVDALGLKTPA